MGSNTSSEAPSSDRIRGLLDTSATSSERIRSISLESGISISEPAGTASAAMHEDEEVDSDSSEATSTGSSDEIIIYPNRQEDLITVFRQLVRSGQIHVLSSDEETDEEDPHLTGIVGSHSKAARVPKIKYRPDVERIQQNDITFQQRTNLGLDTKQGRSIPQLLKSRECGQISSATGGFDRPHRNLIASNFLPNSVRKIANYGYKAFCGTYSKDGDLFLSASQDRSLRIYDTTKGEFKEFRRILARDVGWSVLDTAFSPNGREVAYTSWSEAIHICKIYSDNDDNEREYQEALPLAPDTRRFCIFSIAFSDSGKEILGGSNDGYLYIYDREQNQRVLKIFAHDDDVNSVAFADETSNILFSVADDGLIKVWDRRSLNEEDPKPVGVMAGHIDGITYVESKKDGRYILTNSKDQSMKLWDMRAFSSTVGIDNAKKALSSHNWDYRWQRVPKRLCIPRKPLEGDTSVMTYRGHSVLNTLIRCHFSPAFSTGQRYVYTGCAAGRVVIYDLLTGEMEHVLKGHHACVRDVSWHPYLPEIVSTSWDNSIGLWTYEGKHVMTDTEAGVCGINVNEDDHPPSKKPDLRRSPRLSRSSRGQAGDGAQGSTVR